MPTPRRSSTAWSQLPAEVVAREAAPHLLQVAAEPDPHVRDVLDALAGDLMADHRSRLRHAGPRPRRVDAVSVKRAVAAKGLGVFLRHVFGVDAPPGDLPFDCRGILPGHRDRHPSMRVWPAKGRAWCFVCGTGGDALDLLVLGGKASSFREALALAAAWAEVPA